MAASRRVDAALRCLALLACFLSTATATAPSTASPTVSPTSPTEAPSPPPCRAPVCPSNESVSVAVRIIGAILLVFLACCVMCCGVLLWWNTRMPPPDDDGIGVGWTRQEPTVVVGDTTAVMKQEAQRVVDAVMLTISRGQELPLPGVCCICLDGGTVGSEAAPSESGQSGGAAAEGSDVEAASSAADVTPRSGSVQASGNAPFGDEQAHCRDWALLPCSHPLHWDCLREWLTSRFLEALPMTCPSCRSDLAVDSTAIAAALAASEQAAAAEQ